MSKDFALALFHRREAQVNAGKFLVLFLAAPCQFAYFMDFNNLLPNPVHHPDETTLPTPAP